MRIITLPKDRKEAEEMFNLFYTAAFAGEGSPDQESARKLGKLQDALEVVSYDKSLTAREKDAAGGTDEATRRVLDQKCKEITLEDAHWSTLIGRFFGAGISWHPSVSRKVIQAYDLVENAEEKAPGAK